MMFSIADCKTLVFYKGWFFVQNVFNVNKVFFFFLMFGGFIPKLFLFQNVFTHKNYRNPTSKHSKKSQTMCVTLLISMMLGINCNAQQFVTYECSSLYVTIHWTFFCSGFHLINHKYEQMMAFCFHLKWWWNLAKMNK